ASSSCHPVTLLISCCSARVATVYLPLLACTKSVHHKSAVVVLGNTDLFETDLSDADLHTVVLRDSDLSRTALCGANLSYADLTGADLRLADLTRADVSHADLTRANLTDAVGVSREQLDSCKSLEGATMTDGQTLKGDKTLNGPTFKTWLKNKKSRGED
ncbi:MAG: pentapeptide repeat-containing protein, partial [Actinomycetota bacterium]|nr:pentapeptide repeat-containing protein [Actinomycetota bacterium]